jgi:hypothetical protein
MLLISFIISSFFLSSYLVSSPPYLVFDLSGIVLLNLLTLLIYIKKVLTIGPVTLNFKMNLHKRIQGILAYLQGHIGQKKKKKSPVIN